MLKRTKKSKYIPPDTITTKALFLGAPSVGRTQFLHRFFYDHFLVDYDPDGPYENDWIKDYTWCGIHFHLALLDVDVTFNLSTLGNPGDYTYFKEYWLDSRNEYLDVVAVFFSITDAASWETAQDLVKMIDSMFPQGPLVSETISDASKFDWDECGNTEPITIPDPPLNRGDYNPCSIAINDYSNMSFMVQTGHRPPILLIGTKNDLNTHRMVEPQSVRDFAITFECDFVEVSSKTSLNVMKAFDKIMELHFLNEKALFEESIVKPPSVLSKLKRALSTSTSTSTSGASTSTVSTPPPKSKDGKS